MYLDKVFIKHSNICVVPKKELVCVFPFLDRNLLEIKKRLQNATERTLPYCKLKVIFKSASKIVDHFHFKDVIPKESLLISRDKPILNKTVKSFPLKLFE